MTTYTLLNGVTGTQSAPGTALVDANGAALPPGSNLPQGSVRAHPVGGAGLPVGGPVNQSFQVNVSGSGAVSATVQIIGSNDGVLWFPYGTAVTASGTGVGVAAASGNVQFENFSAYVTALSGTSATVKVVMSG